MSLTAWVALSLARQLGGKTFQALLDHFGHDLNVILSAEEKSLREVPGIGAVTARAIRQVDLEQVEQRINRWRHAGVQILTWDNSQYPEPLRGLTDAPPTLYVRGTLPEFTHSVAIVGTRTPSDKARRQAEDLAQQVAAACGVVVSGLAMGIDHAAHLSVLASPGINSVAVLGSGIMQRHIYPPENRKLAEAILARGAIMCEVAPDTNVSTPGLVARNRIISGLAQSVIIVETEVDGGAMHAARFAKMQNRAVYTINSETSGNQALLANGDALPIEQFVETMEEMGR